MDGGVEEVGWSPVGCMGKEGSFMNFGLRAVLAFCSLIFIAAPSFSAERQFYQGKNVNFRHQFRRRWTHGY